MFPTQVQQIEANKTLVETSSWQCSTRRATVSAENLVDSAEAEELPIVLFELPVDRLTDPALSELRRSDHSAFWDHDYPGMLLTDTANYRNPYYHCEEGPDTVDTLDTDFALRVVQSVTAAAARALDER